MTYVEPVGPDALITYRPGPSAQRSGAVRHLEHPLHDLARVEK